MSTSTSVASTSTEASASAIQRATQTLLHDQARSQQPWPAGWRLPRIRQARSEHCHYPLTTHTRTACLLFSSVAIVQLRPRGRKRAGAHLSQAHAGTLPSRKVTPSDARTGSRSRPSTKVDGERTEEWISASPRRHGWIPMKPKPRCLRMSRRCDERSPRNVRSSLTMSKYSQE